MTYALLALTILILIAAFLVVRAERAFWIALLAQHAKDTQVREDRLLNRIQKPEAAVYESIVPAPGPAYVSMYEEFQPEVNADGADH